MADVRPQKVVDGGDGTGTLREFADGDTVPVALGGTGATNATQARANLGIVDNSGIGVGLIAPTFLNGWSAFGGRLNGYRKVAGWVEMILNPTHSAVVNDSVVLQLPAGYRPTADTLFVAAANGNITLSGGTPRFVVTAAGDVSFSGAGSLAGSWVVTSVLARFPAA